MSACIGNRIRMIRLTCRSLRILAHFILEATYIDDDFYISRRHRIKSTSDMAYPNLARFFAHRSPHVIDTGWLMIWTPDSDVLGGSRGSNIMQFRYIEHTYNVFLRVSKVNSLHIDRMKYFPFNVKWKMPLFWLKLYERNLYNI